MPTYPKSGLAVATALALMCAPALLAAAPSSSVTWSAPGTQSADFSPSRSFLEAANQSHTQGALKPATASGSTYALTAFTLPSSGLGELQGRADLLLWNLCAVVRSQQGSHHFDAIDHGIDTVHLSEEIEKVSAVPLPGAVWLFVMGVMGLAGARVTGITRTKAGTAGVAGQRLWLGQGGATPA